MIVVQGSRTRKSAADQARKRPPWLICLEEYGGDRVLAIRPAPTGQESRPVQRNVCGFSTLNCLWGQSPARCRIEHGGYRIEAAHCAPHRPHRAGGGPSRRISARPWLLGGVKRRSSSFNTARIDHLYQPYAIAKIAAIKMVAAYRSQYDSDFINVMPINLYGPGDNFITPNTATSSPRYPPLS